MKTGRTRRRRELLVLALVLCSCTSESERLTAEQKKVVDEYVDDSAPSPRVSLEVVFDRRIKLLGYDIDATEWRPGEPLHVTWYWEVLAPPRAETRIWTEIEGPGLVPSAPVRSASPLRDAYGPEHWRAGQFLRDRQTLFLPDDWAASSAVLRVGVAVGDEETVTSPPMSVSTAVSTSTPSRTRPVLEGVRTKASPQLDGSLSDAAWAFANWTSPFVASNANVDDIVAKAKVLWDPRYLYVGIDVRGAPTSGAGAGRCERGCVTLLVAPADDTSRAFEIQVSRRGAVFDTRYDRSLDPIGDSEWSSRARAAVASNGSEPEPGYSVEIAIPWQAFSPRGDVFPPPRVGDQWRFNVGVVDSGQADRNAVAWSPLGADDFHVPDRFGILRFEGAPEHMKGSSTPAELPEGRMPAPMRRSVDPAVRDTLLEKNAAETNRLDAVRGKGRELQTLESSEGGH